MPWDRSSRQKSLQAREQTREPCGTNPPPRTARWASLNRPRQTADPCWRRSWYRLPGAALPLDAAYGWHAEHPPQPLRPLATCLAAARASGSRDPGRSDRSDLSQPLLSSRPESSCSRSWMTSPRPLASGPRMSMELRLIWGGGRSRPGTAVSSQGRRRATRPRTKHAWPLILPPRPIGKIG